MRVNLEWLREWVGFDLEAEPLAEQLTIGGLEVDSVERIVPTPPEIVVAEVVEVAPHPDADRLTVCAVSDGGERTRAVVCGAPNAAAGLKTAFAPAGSTLPNGLAIQARELRGVTSEGMLCSAAELGLDKEASGILELDADAPVGEPLRDYLRLDDAVLDVDLTPNRGDCFSVLGIARETAALNGRALVPPEVEPVAPRIEDRFSVKLAEPAACPRFVGRVVRNVDSGRTSPAWLRERLRRAGLRPLHPVVDVTNFVMLELGQPLHGYDLGKLDTQISVRLAEPGEKLTLLDGTETELAPDVLVIADASGAIGMAGIMGGESTAVETTTRDVFLESAFFSPAAIAGRARRHGLHTDASLRFERGVDPAQQARAIERATRLLLEIAGGDPGPVMITESRDHLPGRDPIELRHGRLEAVLGVSVPAHQVEENLRLLQMGLTPTDGGWSVVPPSFRFDIGIEEDLIEEVGRMVGYDTIPVTVETGPRHLGTSSETRVPERRMVDLLVERGYSEIITYSFIDETLESAINPGVEPLLLANPISRELRAMRRSLWPGLLGAARQNLARQQRRVRLLEVGTQFAREEEGVLEASILAGLALGPQWPEHWENDDREVDFFDVKADLEAILALTGRGNEVRFAADEHPALMPGQTARVRMGSRAVGWLGTLHPELQERLELKHPAILFALKLNEATRSRVPAFKPYSKFPSVRRDIALVIDEETSAEQIVECVRGQAGDLLQNITLFDIYRGMGIDSSRKSIALGLILQDTYRTLTDEDVERVMTSVTRHLERDLGATIRK